MLYINGKPYVVRESTRPFANLEYTGAHAGHVPANPPFISEQCLEQADGRALLQW